MAAKPGLQTERTQLSWERSAIGFLAIGAIVLFRHDGPLAQGRTALAVLAITLALIVFRVGRVRSRRMQVSDDDRGAPVVRSPKVAVLVTGGAAVALAVALLVALAVS